MLVREAGGPHARHGRQTNLAQIDFFLIKNRCTNPVLVVTSHTGCFLILTTLVVGATKQLSLTGPVWR